VTARRRVLSVAPGTVRRVATTAVLLPDLVSRVPPPRTWMARAACADPRLDSALRAVFTADEPTELDTAAQQVCAGCPVRADCVDHTAGIHAQFIAGIWGGRRRGHRTTDPTGQHRAWAPAGPAPGSYRGRVAARQHQRFSPVQVTQTVTPAGTGPPSRPSTCSSRAAPLDQVITRTGYDPRWLTAQHRRVTSAG